MRDAHHAHVRAAAHTTLLHHVSYLIDDIHKRHRTRSHSSRRSNQSTGRAQEFISHARAATGLMNGRRSFGVIHDSGYRVGNVQDKTSCQLSISFAGIDQARRIGNKLARQHHIAHGVEK